MEMNAKLPLGMRLNNPGNLRSQVGTDKPTVRVEGFAKFDTLMEGTFSLCKLVAGYQQFHGWRTPADFIGHYAPASENDVSLYLAKMCAFTHMNPLHAATATIGLDRAWRALDWMRGLVRVEQGGVPSSWACSPEWVPLSMWIDAMRGVNLWSGQL